MHRQRGLGLVEVLAALVVLVAGLAAAAGALVQALRLEADAAALTQATRLGRDLAEELRALPRPDGQAPASIAGIDPVEACADFAGACAAEELARDLRSAWRLRVASQLGPEAAGDIVLADAGMARFMVSVRRHRSASVARLAVDP